MLPWPNRSAWEHAHERQRQRRIRPRTPSAVTGTAIAALIDAARTAQRKVDSRDTAPAEFVRWLLIAAAIFGALLLMRSMRRIGGIAFGLFWLWFWTHGGLRHLLH